LRSGQSNTNGNAYGTPSKRDAYGTAYKCDTDWHAGNYTDANR
jgi:hypothetical protein